MCSVVVVVISLVCAALATLFTLEVWGEGLARFAAEVFAETFLVAILGWSGLALAVRRKTKATAEVASPRGGKLFNASLRASPTATWAVFWGLILVTGVPDCVGVFVLGFHPLMVCLWGFAAELPLLVAAYKIADAAFWRTLVPSPPGTRR